MADKAVDAVKKSVSSFWKYASGYATQMFTEEDLESEAIMIGDDKVRRPQNFHPPLTEGACTYDVFENFGIFDPLPPPLSVPNPRNLPSLGQKLAYPLPPPLF